MRRLFTLRLVYIAAIYASTSNLDFPDNLPFTNEQLAEAGILGKGGSGYVEEILWTMSKHPELEPLSFLPYLYHTYRFAFRSEHFHPRVYSLLWQKEPIFLSRLENCLLYTQHGLEYHRY
ncbi:hypothetical protein BC827DRAFT_1376115, partial [Russula dissimulans]